MIKKCDIKLALKNLIKLAKGSLDNIFQDSFNEIVSQQLTQNRSYIYPRKVGGVDLIAWLVVLEFTRCETEGITTSGSLYTFVSNLENVA